jgi:hypothetical protein
MSYQQPKLTRGEALLGYMTRYLDSCITAIGISIRQVSDPGDTKTGSLKRVRENETIAWIPVTDERKPHPMVMTLISIPDEELKLGWRDEKGRFLTGNMSEPEIARDWTDLMTHWARVDGPRSGENP